MRNVALTSVKAFLPNDNEVIKIIDMCDLDPSPKTWRLWTDGNGNNLIIRNDKTVFSKKTKPTTRYPIIIKDIYYKSSAKQISNNSKWAMVSLAESIEESIPNICFLWFLGIDDKLRLVCYMKDAWVENKSPLSSGILSLRTIIKNMEESYKVIMGSGYISGPYEGNIVKSWAVSWPPSKNFQLDLLLTNRTIGDKILKDCGVL